MKLARLPEEPGSKPLASEAIQTIARELGVSLGTVHRAARRLCQQFGVSDEDGIYAGDIYSHAHYFTEDELRSQITQLFSDAEAKVAKATKSTKRPKPKV